MKSLHHNLHTPAPVTTTATASTRPEARALSLTEQSHGWTAAGCWLGGADGYWNSFNHDFNDMGNKISTNNILSSTYL